MRVRKEGRGKLGKGVLRLGPKRWLAVRDECCALCKSLRLRRAWNIEMSGKSKQYKVGMLTYTGVLVHTLFFEATRQTDCQWVRDT